MEGWGDFAANAPEAQFDFRVPSKAFRARRRFFATFFARLAAVELETIEKFYSQFLVWPISLISTESVTS